MSITITDKRESDNFRYVASVTSSRETTLEQVYAFEAGSENGELIHSASFPTEYLGRAPIGYNSLKRYCAGMLGTVAREHSAGRQICINSGLSQTLESV